MDNRGNTSQKKKLFFVITKSNWGGAQRYVFDLAKNIPKDLYDISVVCGGDGALSTALKQENIRVISVPHLARDLNILNEFKVLFQLISLFGSERPDIIHLNSSKIGGIGALAGRITRIPNIIYTAHGWAFNEDRNFFWRFTTYIISWMTALLVHTIITISYTEEKEAFTFLFVRSKKIRMIYIGLTGQKLIEQKEARHVILQSVETKPKDTALWVGSIGELIANKGHIYALEAVKRIHDMGIPIFYTIIGKGELRKKLELFIQKNNMEAYAVLPGAIPTPQNGATLLNAFDIFLFPSLKEGLPFALLEALLSKTPSIASNVGGISEIIESKKTGLLIPPKNVDEIVTAIRYFTFDPRIRNDYGIAGNLHIHKTFSFQHMLDQTLLEYK